MRDLPRRLARRVVPYAALVLIALGGGCSGNDDAPPNLLLVTIDTARADRFGCYGAAKAGTPNLDRLAEEGVLFELAVSVTSVTLPSHLSLLGGRYPPRHGVRVNGEFLPPGGATMLAEHLGRQGYRSAAVVAAYVLSAEFGIAEGFEIYDEPRETRASIPAGTKLRHQPIVERPAVEISDIAGELLDGQLEEPFFLWLHYYDPHGEYTPPEPYAGRFDGDPYQGEIAYVDAELGRVLDGLRSDGRLDRTLVAVTADHGESRGEHGEETHGLFVYESTQRVPLVLRLPGQLPPGTRSGHLVSGVDLAPTLLDLLGLPPLSDIDGKSFADAARGIEMPPRVPVYAEAEFPARAYGWAALYALHDGRTKFIEAPERELYDLTTDPGETTNLAAERQNEIADWARRLERLRAGWPTEPTDDKRVLDAEARERLSALGYLSGSDTPPSEGNRPDPKNLVQLHNLLNDAQRLVAVGALDQARELLQKALDADPTNPTALEACGTLLCSTGRCDLGIELLLAAARQAPYAYQTQRNLGNALHVAGRLDEAVTAFRAAIELQPRSADDRFALGNVLFAKRDVAGALASYDEAIRLGLDSASLQAAIGVARSASGDVAGARVALERAVELDPSLAGAWNHLGIVSEKEQRYEEAYEHYGRALELAPDHAGALFNMAKVDLRLGRLDAAAARLRSLFAAHPTYAAGHLLSAQLHLARDDEPAARADLQRLLALPELDPRLQSTARTLLDSLDTP